MLRLRPPEFYAKTSNYLNSFLSGRLFFSRENLIPEFCFLTSVISSDSQLSLYHPVPYLPVKQLITGGSCYRTFITSVLQHTHTVRIQIPVIGVDRGYYYIHELR